MTLKVKVNQEVGQLDDANLREVEEFVAFLRFRSRRTLAPKWDEGHMSAPYAEFAEKDRALAEMGLADYAAGHDE